MAGDSATLDVAMAMASASKIFLIFVFPSFVLRRARRPKAFSLKPNIDQLNLLRRKSRKHPRVSGGAYQQRV
jgi:hypothetical protein